MRNSYKLGVYAALCASIAFAGCSDDDDDSTSTGGSGGASSGGKAGQTTGGSSAGKGGNASAGKGGSGPVGGSGGKGGTAGSDNAGGANMAGEGGAVPGAGGAGGDAGVECTDADLGAGGSAEGGSGAGGAPGVTTAVVLIDSVVVQGAAVVAEWQFDDATTISDATNYPADKWSRIVFDPGSLGDDAGAHATFLACDGDPDAGSLKAVVPFSAADQYFELGCPFAAADYSTTTITARVKLISGGKPDAACPVRGQLYTTGGTAQDGAGFALVEGDWVTLTLTIPAGTTMVDRVGIRLNTYGC